MQGRLDSSLTDKGIQQATWLRDALNTVDFSVIYASPSPRTVKTAEILRHQRATEIVGHDDLREIDMGVWEGQTHQEVEQQFAASHTAFWETPHLYTPENGGESFYDVQKRVLPLFKILLEKHEGETILIVTHTVTLKTIMCHCESRPLERLWHPPFIHPTALCKVVVKDQQHSIELYGDMSHLNGQQPHRDASHWEKSRKAAQ